MAVAVVIVVFLLLIECRIFVVGLFVGLFVSSQKWSVDFFVKFSTDQ